MSKEMEESRGTSKENDREVIQHILSWDSESSSLEQDEQNHMQNATLRSKLTESARLLTVLARHSFMDNDTVIPLANVLIKICKRRCSSFLIYNIRKVLVCLFTKFLSKDLIVMYQSSILKEIEHETCWRKRLVYLEITSDIIQASDGNSLNDWLEILLSHWTVVCRNIFATLCNTWEVSDNASNKETTCTYKSRSDQDVCDVQCKSIFMVGYKLTLLWTDIIKKCFSNFVTLRTKLLSFLLPIPSVIQYLGKRHTENDSYKLMLFKSLIRLLNTIIDYGQNLCMERNLDDTFMCLAQDVLNWLRKSSFDSFPYSEEKGFAGEMTVQPRSENELKSILEIKAESSGGSQAQKEEKEAVNVTPAMTQLCSLSLLVFKTVATLARFGSKNYQVFTAMEVLKQLDLFINKFYAKDFDWIHTVFLDQDDNWIEALLTLLDTYLNLQNRQTMVANTDYILNICPHRQFLWFLHCTGFDHSIVVDLLISPETCFLLYLTKYLKIIAVEWQIFVEKLSIMEKELKEFKSVSITALNNCTMSARNSTGVKRVQGDQTCHFDSNVKKTRIESFPIKGSATEMFSNWNRECIRNTTSDIESANSPANSGLYSGYLASRHSELSLLESGNRSKCCEDFSATSIESSINSKFPGSDRMNSSSIASSESPVSGLSLLASYNDEREEDDESDDIDDNSNSSFSDNEFNQSEDNDVLYHPCKTDSLLDRTMAVLIRTRLKLEEFAFTGELAYNCKPLVALIEGCENLYEDK